MPYLYGVGLQEIPYLLVIAIKARASATKSGAYSYPAILVPYVLYYTISAVFCKCTSRQDRILSRR